MAECERAQPRPKIGPAEKSGGGTHRFQGSVGATGRGVGGGLAGRQFGRIQRSPECAVGASGRECFESGRERFHGLPLSVQLLHRPLVRHLGRPAFGVGQRLTCCPADSTERLFEVAHGRGVPRFGP